MNLFFRIIGEVVEWIRPHPRSGSAAPASAQTAPKSARRRKVKPRRLHAGRAGRHTHRQHARRRPPKIELSREAIWVNGAYAGEFVSDHAIVTPDFVYKWAKSSRNLTRYLRSLPLPAEFTWFYVDVITVHREWRGKGIAKAVFRQIEKQYKPVLFMLMPAQPQAVGWGAKVQEKNAEDRMSQARRMAVYRNLGFDLVTMKNPHFGRGAIGFRWVQ